MATSSKESTAVANLLGKRNPEDDLETRPILKKHKEASPRTRRQRKANFISVKETVEEPDETVEETGVTKNTLFIGHLSHRSKISDIIYFFKDVGEVVRVRLIVDHRSKLVGCGFVEFASANEAEKFFHNKIFLDVAEKAPYLLRPKSNFAEKLWYEDNLQREPNLKKQEEISQGFCGKKITFSYDD